MQDPRRAAFHRLGGCRLLSAGLSLVCLGMAARIAPAARPGTESAVSPPGARLSDDGVAALPSAVRRTLADSSWLFAVQYYGNRRLEGSPKFPELGALVEQALRLDPSFRPAALLGPLLLAEPPPLGAGEPQRADDILAGWMRRNPGDFDAVLLRSLLQTWHLQDPATGATLLEAASTREDAPPWLVAVAARALTGVGSRATARNLWRALQQRADDERIRSNARTHLLQLDALDRLDQLGAVVRDYERRSGRRPRGWQELVAAGMLPARPVDPAGTPFVLDQAGVPAIAPESPLAGHPGR
ncbi:MAG: hypothetical protein OXI45_00230 [Acidobacteriota bacterium]|nr:hypothetical protein [Acidobacteriota bacterium]MXW70574.1 hypothetical protein [Acidobacteriota bacterium]MYE43626.1 hypothetical protein [Acidobacteriota bacterium]MYF77782.1 hypothetical protein [Acidobacteriota bacterium]